MRTIHKQYDDPLDLVWKSAAKRLGIIVVRNSEVFAAWDGVGTLKIGTPETLDPDDSLAQMIFHELCHALVEGPDKFGLPDWGLNMDEANHFVHEHAALRLQAALADQFQLRQFFASTTDFRSYFDGLGESPLQEGADDPAIALARLAWPRATEGAWGNAIHTALKQTRQIFDLVTPLADKNSLWNDAKVSRTSSDGQ
jgi:hypothetical protein